MVLLHRQHLCFFLISQLNKSTSTVFVHVTYSGLAWKNFLINYFGGFKWQINSKHHLFKDYAMKMQTTGLIASCLRRFFISVVGKRSLSVVTIINQCFHCFLYFKDCFIKCWAMTCSISIISQATCTFQDFLMLWQLE